MTFGMNLKDITGTKPDEVLLPKKKFKQLNNIIASA